MNRMFLVVRLHDLSIKANMIFVKFNVTKKWH